MGSGGIMGSPLDWMDVTMANCYGGGNIYGEYPGGLVGKHNWSSTAATGINCYYLLSDTVTNSVGHTSQSVESTGITEVTQDIIDSLNAYIEEDPDGINTTGWAKWVYNENSSATLDLKITWNGTEWVTE